MVNVKSQSLLGDKNDVHVLRYPIHKMPKYYSPYKESNQENLLVFHRSELKKKLYQEIFQNLFAEMSKYRSIMGPDTLNSVQNLTSN